MIVESISRRLIGEEFILPEFEYGIGRKTKAKIMREATETEYIQDCLADPSMPDSSRHLMVVTNDPNRFWYEVSAD